MPHTKRHAHTHILDRCVQIIRRQLDFLKFIFFFLFFIHSSCCSLPSSSFHSFLFFSFCDRLLFQCFYWLPDNGSSYIVLVVVSLFSLAHCIEWSFHTTHCVFDVRILVVVDAVFYDRESVIETPETVPKGILCSHHSRRNTNKHEWDEKPQWWRRRHEIN